MKLQKQAKKEGSCPSESVLQAQKENYQKDCAAISDAEVNAAEEILQDPRIAQAGLTIVKATVQEGAFQHDVWKLCGTNCQNVDFTTRTERKTLKFAACVMAHAKAIEVTKLLQDYRVRAAKLGKELDIKDASQSEFHYGWDSYARTYGGLERFRFDLNADEIYAEILKHFGEKLKELNWYIIRGEHTFQFFTDKEVFTLNYHATSMDFIAGVIQGEKSSFEI